MLGIMLGAGTFQAWNRCILSRGAQGRDIGRETALPGQSPTNLPPPLLSLCPAFSILQALLEKASRLLPSLTPTVKLLDFLLFSVGLFHWVAGAPWTPGCLVIPSSMWHLEFMHSFIYLLYFFYSTGIYLFVITILFWVKTEICTAGLKN